MNNSELVYVDSDGLKLAVEVFGQGPPLIFAHGLTGERHGTQRQFASLADRYRIISFDQRGHGQSTPVTDPALYDFRRMAEDITAILDALDVERAIVGGESMGAATMLTFSLTHPQRVERLLITAPAFSDQPNVQREDIWAAGDLVEKEGVGVWLERSAEVQRTELGWSEEVIEYIAGARTQHNDASIATALKTVIDWVILPDLTPLAGLDMPACVIAWPNDPLHPQALAKRVADALPNACLETLPSILGLFSRPEVVGEIYGRFLEKA